MAGQVAIACGLACLPLQVGKLEFDFLDDVGDARQVHLRGVELEFGFVATRMQACNAGRFLEDRAARNRLGVDQLSDLSLAHEGR